MTAYKYQNKLHSIKQWDFYTIRAYISQVEENVERLALCYGWSHDIKTDKVREIFYCCLDETVGFELTKLSHRDYQSTIYTLLEMESFLIEKIYCESEMIFQHVYENNNENQGVKKSSHKYKTHGINKTKNFCNFHKTNE
ncbi:hypothetical protein EQH57_0239 [Dictyocoela roeselum]|nr:hypothetical protein EQH57_0239 [Dictyocoela roeselum]